jgi:DNA-binding transcriptional MocR family regulator
MNLEPLPAAVDEFGLRPDALFHVIDRAQAMILTPRAHNPTGAALHRLSAAALRGMLQNVPDLLVIEDDHLGPISGAPGVTTTLDRKHWAVVRSVAKSLGPDLRLAFVGGDAETIARVEGRLALGPGWVSHYLQNLVYDLLNSEEVRRMLERAHDTYRRRRRALRTALKNRGIESMGRSGFNVWVEVDDEPGVVSRLLRSGWAVAPGARYRLRTPPAIRITCATLPEDLADSFASDLVQALVPSRRGRTG